MLHCCEICGQGDLPSEEDLRAHVKNVHIQGSSQCPFCDLAGVTAEQMRTHVHSAHPEYDEPEEGDDNTNLSNGAEADPSQGARSKRPRTEFSWSFPDATKAKIEQETLSCPLCSHTDVDPVQMQIHVNRAHFDPSTDAASTSDCDKDASASSSCKSSCPLCSDTFSTADSLQSHVDREHGDVLSPRRPPGRPGGDRPNGLQDCPVCSKSGFVDGDALEAHINGHFGAADDTERDEDRLLALELDRRERETRKAAEEAEFRKLRAENGMDETGNYGGQADSGMQRAVRRGNMSVVDYHERTIDLRNSEMTGADDGRSFCRDALAAVRTASSSSRDVVRSHIASVPVFHCASTYGDKGWGCGYRNLQMLLSSLASRDPYKAKLTSAGVISRNGTSLSLPSIQKIQGLIENAWRAGFDVAGAEQLGGRLRGTRKWIGSTEIAAFLRHVGVDARVIDFHRPTAPDGTHPELFRWVATYFRSKYTEGSSSFAPPLYFQHQGHSRTIVGTEELKNGGSRLLVFDPIHSRQHMSRATAAGNTETAAVMRSLRKLPNAIKSRQYQVVWVDGVFESEAAAAQRKVIGAVRIPE